MTLPYGATSLEDLVALTVWQPWASAIMCGAKPVENRGWFPWQRLIGQWIAIHAAARKPDIDDVMFCRSTMAKAVASGLRFPPTTAGPLSAIVGIAHLAGAYRLDENAPRELRTSPWAFGPVLWHFDQVRRLEEPILGVRGMPGLWAVEPAHVAVLRRLGES